MVLHRFTSLLSAGMRIWKKPEFSDVAISSGLAVLRYVFLMESE